MGATTATAAAAAEEFPVPARPHPITQGYHIPFGSSPSLRRPYTPHANTNRTLYGSIHLSRARLSNERNTTGIAGYLEFSVENYVMCFVVLLLFYHVGAGRLYTIKTMSKDVRTFSL